MREELEKLGFEYDNRYKTFFFELEYKNLEILINSNNVFLSQGVDVMNMFPYSYNKVKQLIELLS